MQSNLPHGILALYCKRAPKQAAAASKAPTYQRAFPGRAQGKWAPVNFVFVLARSPTSECSHYLSLLSCHCACSLLVQRSLTSVMAYPIVPLRCLRHDRSLGTTQHQKKPGPGFHSVTARSPLAVDAFSERCHLERGTKSSGTCHKLEQRGAIHIRYPSRWGNRGPGRSVHSR